MDAKENRRRPGDIGWVLISLFLVIYVASIGMVCIVLWGDYHPVAPRVAAPDIAKQIALAVSVLFGVPLAFGAYFLPAIVSLWRQHRHHKLIFLVNALAGWTTFAWIAAMVWSLTRPQASEHPGFFGRMVNLAGEASEKALRQAETRVREGKPAVPPIDPPPASPGAVTSVEVTVKVK